MQTSMFNGKDLKSLIADLEGRISRQEDGLKRLSKLLDTCDVQEEFTNLVAATEGTLESVQFINSSSTVQFINSSSTVNQFDISSEIAEIESEMEEIRKRRQEFVTAFENFDQKANKLFDILSTVLKSMKEMRSGIVRNLL